MELQWQEDFDDMDNSVWEAQSAFHDGDGNHFKFRIRQKLQDNKHFFWDDSDSEVNGGDYQDWYTLESAKEDMQEANDNIVAELNPAEDF